MSKYIPEHRTLHAYEVFVDEKAQRHAIKRLHERIASGEDPFDILEIDRQYKYYVDKIVAGLSPLSYALYGKIMNLDAEDAYDL